MEKSRQSIGSDKISKPIKTRRNNASSEKAVNEARLTAYEAALRAMKHRCRGMKAFSSFLHQKIVKVVRKTRTILLSSKSEKFFKNDA